jgi:hypothetical protein
MTNPLRELGRRTGFGPAKLALLLGIGIRTVQRHRVGTGDRMPKTLTRQIDQFLALADDDLRAVAQYLTQAYKGGTP